MTWQIQKSNQVIDFVSCDQVIMHTENPELTLSEFVRIIRKNKGEVGCYFYAKKALPRELLDDYFRTKCKDLSSSELWGMSKNLTKLGKILSDLEIEIEVPSIPQLGIKVVVRICILYIGLYQVLLEC